MTNGKLANPSIDVMVIMVTRMRMRMMMMMMMMMMMIVGCFIHEQLLAKPSVITRDHGETFPTRG